MFKEYKRGTLGLPLALFKACFVLEGTMGHDIIVNRTACKTISSVKLLLVNLLYGCRLKQVLFF